jgi:hypothetical protein
MKLQEHVLKAINASNRGDKDEALMHACFAIDGTARNLYSKKKCLRSDYKNCIRSYYWLIEPFIGAGLNLEETKWTHVKLDDGSGKLIQNPDLADIIYHIFRCNHAHANEIPLNYEILESGDGWARWIVNTSNSTLHMPDKIIWALIGVAVFSKGNTGLSTEGDYYLSWGSEALGIGTTKFLIKDHWGKENDLKLFFEQRPQIRVKIEGL